MILYMTKMKWLQVQIASTENSPGTTAASIDRRLDPVEAGVDCFDDVSRDNNSISSHLPEMKCKR